MARLSVKVHPRARSTALTGRLGDAWKLALAAPPVAPEEDGARDVQHPVRAAGAAGGQRGVEDLDRALRHLEVDLALAQRELERRVQPRLVVELLGGLLERPHPLARRQDLVHLGLRKLALELVDARLGLRSEEHTSE